MAIGGKSEGGDISNSGTVDEKDMAMFSRDKECKTLFHTMWHSSAHILAYALESYYGDKIRLLHGPPGEGIPYCFFYEVVLDVFSLFIANYNAVGSCTDR